MGEAVEGVHGVRAGAGAAVHAVERVQGQARRLKEYVQAGGGDPTPGPAVLAALAAGPIPVDQVQQVQSLLAEVRRLAGAHGHVVAPQEAAQAYRRT